MNQIQRVYVQIRKPAHRFFVTRHHVVVIQRAVAFHRGKRGRNLKRLAALIFQKLVFAAVQRVQKALRQICARAEELHVLALAHAAHATGDAIIVAH